MNTLHLENINKHAPYRVRHRENNTYSFYFETDFNLKYTISFMLEYSFVQSGAYQFCINVEGSVRSGFSSYPFLHHFRTHKHLL